MKVKRKILDKKEEHLKLRKIAKKQKIQERGITLIALVVTIIILLILAGVTLNIALSDNGLFNKAKKAADDYNKKSIEEELQILFAEKQLDYYANNSSVKADVTDLLEEKSGGNITQEDIDEFNKYLGKYDEKVTAISKVEDLAKIGQEGESSLPIDGIYVQLEDIESLTLETPIGTEENPFTGVYNGNGKKIKSLSITADKDDTGMFGASEGTIKNVTVENCMISSSKGRVGAIAGNNTGIIENCDINDGTIISNGQYTTSENKTDGSRIGGICGENNDGGIIRNCTNSAIVTGKYKLVGGICGYNLGGNIENCNNKGNVKGAYQVGGIAGDSEGTINQKVHVSNCTNSGNIEFKLDEDVKSEPGYENSSDIGGIVGCNSRFSEVMNCSNSANISASGLNLGGIVGNNYSAISLCKNTGNISANCEAGVTMSNVGGIVGAMTDNSDEDKSIVTKCSNSGKISSTGDSVGGIAGRIHHYDAEVKECYNVGMVTSDNGLLGGISGCSYGSIIRCFNKGIVGENTKNVSKCGRDKWYTFEKWLYARLLQ